MDDRSACIFGNEMPKKVIKKAEGSKRKFVKKYGDDSSIDYGVEIGKNPYVGTALGIMNVKVGKECSGGDFDRDKGIIVGNIRMGFGHYRISMAIASAAHSRGYIPYWMDLNSYPETTCTKVIGAQNDLYSMGSRLSQKSKLFNSLFWEPMNYEGFRQLSYNASDQKNAELMAPVFKNVPRDIPVVATHVWPAQAALHAGMKNVLNAVPDNWPMALHYAEGALHTVQTWYAYQGYRIGNGFLKEKIVKPMPKDSLMYVGHYIDHELVSNIEKDCEARTARVKNGEPMRFLLTIGGAGAQKEIFAEIIKYLLPYVKENKAAIYVNVGDYRNVWDSLNEEIPEMKKISVAHFGDGIKERSLEDRIPEILSGKFDGEPLDKGIHGFWHQNIFEAVYCTNILMRISDVLVTKPSELAFYPVPKLFIKRVGGHEQWGAVHSAEIGDGTLECRDVPHTLQMLDMFLKDRTYLPMMCENIIHHKACGIYDGAYRVVEEAMKLKDR